MIFQNPNVQLTQLLAANCFNQLANGNGYSSSPSQCSSLPDSDSHGTDAIKQLFYVSLCDLTKLQVEDRQ